MGIIDELADRDRRKKNLIVYNLSELAPNNQSDSDAFAALCFSVYKSSFTIAKSLLLGKKLPNIHIPLLLCLEHEEDKLMLLSCSYLLCHNTLYKNICIAIGRTQFEREKHKKLAMELRDRHSKGETGLIICNGAIIIKSPAGSNPATTESFISSTSNQSS